MVTLSCGSLCRCRKEISINMSIKRYLYIKKLHIAGYVSLAVAVVRIIKPELFWFNNQSLFLNNRIQVGGLCHYWLTVDNKRSIKKVAVKRPSQTSTGFNTTKWQIIRAPTSGTMKILITFTIFIMAKQDPRLWIWGQRGEGETSISCFGGSENKKRPTKVVFNWTCL